MRTKLLALFLAAHGIVHWIGFAVPWKLAESKDMPYATTVLWGNVDLGEVGIRIQALFWLPAIALFVLAAYALIRNRSWALRVLAVAAGYSLVICLLNMPQAVAGLVINVVLLAGIAGAKTLRPWLAVMR